MESQTTNLASVWQQMPRALRLFITRGVLLLLCWKCFYLFWLKPLHQPDAWLTSGTAHVITWLFGLFSPKMQPALVTDNYMRITALLRGKRSNIISIANACNALELLVLHFGFIVAATLPLRQKFLYTITGLGLIFVANVVRCLALMYVYIAFPHFFPFAHHYVFTVTIYFIIFLVWKNFIKNWVQYEKERVG